MKKPAIIKTFILFIYSSILVSGIILSIYICDKNKKELLKEQETPKEQALQDTIQKDLLCPACESRHLPGQTHSCNTL